MVNAQVYRYLIYGLLLSSTLNATNNQLEFSEFHSSLTFFKFHYPLLFNKFMELDKTPRSFSKIRKSIVLLSINKLKADVSQVFIKVFCFDVLFFPFKNLVAFNQYKPIGTEKFIKSHKTRDSSRFFRLR